MGTPRSHIAEHTSCRYWSSNQSIVSLGVRLSWATARIIKSEVDRGREREVVNRKSSHFRIYILAAKVRTRPSDDILRLMRR